MNLLATLPQTPHLYHNSSTMNFLISRAKPIVNSQELSLKTLTWNYLFTLQLPHVYVYTWELGNVSGLYNALVRLYTYMKLRQSIPRAISSIVVCHNKHYSSVIGQLVWVNTLPTIPIKFNIHVWAVKGLNAIMWKLQLYGSRWSFGNS